MDDDEAQWEFMNGGYWCPCCGEIIAWSDQIDDPDDDLPDYCGTCGYPDMEEVAAYFNHEEDGDDDDTYPGHY